MSVQLLKGAALRVSSFITLLALKDNVVINAVQH
jgi:hypothetical protein